MNFYFDVLPDEVNVIILLKVIDVRFIPHSMFVEVTHLDNMDEVICSKIFDSVLGTPNFWIIKINGVTSEISVSMIRVLHPEFWNPDVRVKLKQDSLERLLCAYKSIIRNLNGRGISMLKLYLLKSYRINSLPDGEFKTYLQSMYNISSGKLKPKFYDYRMEINVAKDTYTLRIYVIDRSKIRIINTFQITRRDALYLELCFHYYM